MIKLAIISLWVSAELAESEPETDRRERERERAAARWRSFIPPIIISILFLPLKNLTTFVLHLCISTANSNSTFYLVLNEQYVRLSYVNYVRSIVKCRTATHAQQ